MSGFFVVKRAPADVADGRDDCVADLHATADPLVLFVRLDAVDLEQHPEAAAVHRARNAGLLAEPLERGARDDGHRASADPAIDSAGFRPEERERLAGVRGQRLLPRAAHGP